MAVSHPPSDGFFDVKKFHGGKIPYSISMKDDSPFAFAGLLPPAKKTPTWKVKLIKEGVRKAIRERAEMPSTNFSTRSIQHQKLSDSTVDAPRIALCARMRQMLFVVLLPKRDGS
jgi:hypothetical protein